MPVVVVAGAGAAAAGGAAGGAAAGASGGAAAGAAGSAGASSGTAGGAAASGSASGTGASGVGTSGAGASGGASQSGMEQTLSKADPMMSTQSGSLLGNKVKSNFGANAGDGFKAGANSVDGSISGQNVSLNKSDAKAYDRYKERIKDTKDNVDRARNAKDSLTSDEDDEEDNDSYIPDAEALQKERKSKGVIAKTMSLIVTVVFLVFFLVSSLISVIMAPIGVAKEVSGVLNRSDDFVACIIPGAAGGGISTVINASKYFSLAVELISTMELKDFRGTRMSKEALEELLYLSESSYDNSYYPFTVEYLKEYEPYEEKIGEEPIYGDVIVDEEGNPVLDELGNERREITGYEDTMETRYRPIYDTVPCTLNMSDYLYDYYVPWELSYAIAVASDMLGNGDLDPKAIAEDVLEDGLIYQITKGLSADVEYFTDYRKVYYNKLVEASRGSGVSAVGSPVPISYWELRDKAHRVIDFAEEGYLPHVVIIDVQTYLYHYTFKWGIKDGDHYSEEIKKTMNPVKLKEVVDAQGLSRAGKLYMIELLIALDREDLARAVDEALEIGYRFNE